MSVSTGQVAEEFLGRIENTQGDYVGTCFQVTAGVLVTAAHVIQEALQEVDRSNLMGRIVAVAPLTSAGRGNIAARVIAVHPSQDLAVLQSDSPLPAEVPHLAYSDVQLPGTEFYITGCALLDNESRYKSLTTLGQWGRSAFTLNDSLIGAGTAAGAERGMSGSPVLRTSDNAVIGVMSMRYNSEGWSRDRVWFARVEDLVSILPPTVRVPIFRTAANGDDSATRLGVTYEDKSRLANEANFFMPNEWTGAWVDSVAALESSKVLILVAPAGFGSTTFAEQLIVREGDFRLRLAKLEPGDWDRPNAASLPTQAWHGYILDLQDPEHDRPTPEFLRGLDDIATALAEIQSHLIVTIKESLWSNRYATSLNNVRAVRIDQPPDPHALVERFFEEFDPLVVEAVRQDRVRTHLNGMNAIESSQAVGQIVDLLEPFGDRSSLSTSKIAEMIAEVLDNHVDDLDVLFGEEGTNHRSTSSFSRKNDRPLALDDRCLLLTLSIRSAVHLSNLERDWRGFLSELRGKSEEDVRHLDAVLARSGIRGRLKRVRASVDRDEMARLARPAFGVAAVRYVWDNYSEVRRPLVRWMSTNISQDSGRLSPAAWVSTLVRRSQDIEFIRHDLRNIGDKGILKDVLFDACRDMHMRRRAERILYDWAQSAEMQDVVIDVATRLYLLDQRPIAVRRLQRVADSAKISDGTAALVVAAFDQFLADENARAPFLATVSEWLTAAGARASSRFALDAMVRDAEGVEAFLALEKGGILQLKPFLAQLLNDESSHATIVSMFRSANDDASYDALIESLAGAARENGLIASLFRLSGALDSTAGMRNPVKDLSVRLEGYIAGRVVESSHVQA
ncbi:serine protease [Micromonospora taraxaci]|uniref:trypsin-like serine peptidase n=1 Tax=Micromonospora taraxaci TaxID=1316803 RepID=UPI0033D56E9E